MMMGTLFNINIILVKMDTWGAISRKQYTKHVLLTICKSSKIERFNIYLWHIELNTKLLKFHVHRYVYVLC